MSIFQALSTPGWAFLVKSAGRQNGFHLEPKCACKGVQPSRRAFPPDMFAILAPRTRHLCVYGLMPAVGWPLDLTDLPDPQEDSDDRNREQHDLDQKTVAEGKRVSGSVEHGTRRNNKKKKQ